MTAWTGILINLVPLIVFFGLMIGLMKFARVRPRYTLQGLNLLVTYNRRGSDRVALDRAARVVRGYPLGNSWFRRSPVFMDVLDADGRLLVRFASPCLSLADFRGLLVHIRNQLPELEVDPEVEAIVNGKTWPRSPYQRLLAVALFGIIGLFFAISYLSTLLRPAAPAH